MKYNFKNINVNYLKYGEGKDVIVLLHGWGQNIDMMKPIGDNFIKNYNVIILDLPGFGQSDEPKEVWNLNDYVECIHYLLKELGVINPILIGHSFGGKLALLYSSKYDVKKLVVFASPFKKEIKKISLKTKMLKCAKKIPGLNKLENFAKKRIGSTDYKNASDIMRKILVEHVNTDIEEDIKKIKASTLIVWGTLDEAVDVERAYELEKLIKDAGVVIYEGCTHYAYLERLGQTKSVLKSFLEGE